MCMEHSYIIRAKCCWSFLYVHCQSGFVSYTDGVTIHIMSYYVTLHHQDSLSSADMDNHSRVSSSSNPTQPNEEINLPTIVTTPSKGASLSDRDPTSSLPKSHSQSYNVLPGVSPVLNTNSPTTSPSISKPHLPDYPPNCLK